MTKKKKKLSTCQAPGVDHFYPSIGERLFYIYKGERLNFWKVVPWTLRWTSKSLQRSLFLALSRSQNILEIAHLFLITNYTFLVFYINTLLKVDLSTCIEILWPLSKVGKRNGWFSSILNNSHMTTSLCKGIHQSFQIFFRKNSAQSFQNIPEGLSTTSNLKRVNILTDKFEQFLQIELSIFERVWMMIHHGEVIDLSWW